MPAHLAVKRGEPPERLGARLGLARMLDITQPTGVADEVGHRHERRERGGEHHGTRARSAAAVRRREGLVQVEVHRVDAEIARAGFSGNRIEIGAVGVEERARPMHRRGDREHIALEQPAGVRVGQHEGSNLGGDMLFHLDGIHRAVAAGRHRLDPISQQRRTRRIGAVGGFRHQHDRACVGARGERRLDRHQAA